MTFSGRRALVALIAVLAVIALLVTASTSAHQTLVRSHVTANGTTVVSGFSGGAPLAPAAKP
jgi:methionine-rich copper-binding protein CopC